MRCLTRYLILIMSLCCGASWAFEMPTEDKINKQAITLLFADYMGHYNAYLRGEKLEGITQMYTPTVMLMSSSNIPQSIDNERFTAQVALFLDNLKSQGVTSVHWQQVNIRLLDNNIAVATNLAVRYGDNGAIFNKVGATYLLYKTDDHWRIASFAVHEHTGVQTL
ncbi:hypothetical protein AAEU32_04150 [Pseudoalteromonas sp. SSDWG2]|uniref:DUF6841 family protein n=1 Tax=Pseudoalteromonas sp. SSDWG2 TaxID=3139391 RepID=UPI003BA8902B